MNAPASVQKVDARPPAKTVDFDRRKTERRAPTKLERLIELEGQILGAKDRLDLKHIAANGPRGLTKLGHIILVTRRGSKWRVEGLSSQAGLDQTSPFLQDLTRALNHMVPRNQTEATAFVLDVPDYPFAHGYWCPFAPRPDSGAVLFTHSAPIPDTETPILQRLARTTGIAWTALGAKKRGHFSLRKKRVLLGLTVGFAALMCVPVPMTTLAPSEVIADKPYIMTAPIEGVVETMKVPPNTVVSAGKPLVQFVDTDLRNELDIAEQDLALSAARKRRSSLTAFVDEQIKRDLAVAEADFNLAQARRDYALERLSKTELRAPHDGLVLYSDPQDWAGRPVSVGETLMQIANPARVTLRLAAPLANGEALQEGARVRLFLDADPLRPLDLTLDHASYYADPQPEGKLAYTVMARFDSGQDLPRIGARGTAKIYGEKAPLGLWLARKPLASLRQIFGF